MTAAAGDLEALVKQLRRIAERVSPSDPTMCPEWQAADAIKEYIEVDRQKTFEINTLVKENREQAATIKQLVRERDQAEQFIFDAAMKK